MNARAWRRALTVVLIGTAVAAGPSVTASADPVRVDGDEVASATDDGGLPAAETIVALPDLAFAHRLPGGGINLWRMPLSELEEGFGRPQLVRTLNYGGFSYDRSVTVTGDFADVTASDDGTADYIIWHAQPNGGVLVWAVGGGGNPIPQLWMDLRSGGWSWANSRPMVADVNGDGWDDLVVRHRIVGTTLDNIWVFLSDGQRLAEPRLWERVGGYTTNPRYLLADMDGDGYSNLVVSDVTGPPWARQLELMVSTPEGVHPIWSGFYGYGILFSGHASAGWSFDGSRQLAGDVTGDGRDDLVTIHLQAGGGMLVWVHPNCNRAWPCVEPPQVWQNLRTGGWSFAGSKQGLADTDGDGVLDLVSVHQQSGNPGMLVWRHRSDGSRLLPPEIVADLRVGGWSYASSRAGIAHTFGVLVE
jgi:hypothetical protein